MADDADGEDRSRRRTRLIAAGAVVAVAAIVGGVLLLGDDDGSSGDRSEGADVTSGASPERFVYPTEVTGLAGEETVLVNDDDTPHTFTSDDGLFDSGTLQPGDELSISTLPAGEYGYHCSIHPDLVGSLTIE